MQEHAPKKRQVKPFEQLTITDDFMFGKVMREPEICRRLLEILLNIRIQKIVIIENEKFIHPDYDARGIRLDIYAEDEGQTVYNVEMQTSDTGELPKRSRYYQALMDLNILDRGKPVDTLKNSLIIFICTFDLFRQGDYIYVFENRCIRHPGLRLNDETAKIFINIKGHGEAVTEEFRSLMDYFNGKPPSDDFTREVENMVERVRRKIDLSVEYKAWNLMKEKLLDEGWMEGQLAGIDKGEAMSLIRMACRKLAKGCTAEETADILEEEPDKIRRIFQAAEPFAPEYDVEAIYAALQEKRPGESKEACD